MAELSPHLMSPYLSLFTTKYTQDSQSCVEQTQSPYEAKIVAKKKGAS